jgi:hypothetical protein
MRKYVQYMQYMQYVLALQYFSKDSDAQDYLVTKDKFAVLRIKLIRFNFVLIHPDLIRGLI